MKGSSLISARAGLLAIMIAASASVLPAKSGTQGEVRFRPEGRVEKLAGVWVDGVYLGYVDELKGSNKVLLIPGEHEIAIRHVGYMDFVTKVRVQPGMKHDVAFTLESDPRTLDEEASSAMKIYVKPSRAAVFLNGSFAGHVDEFDGPGQWMQLPPGTYEVRITLPGYSPFESKITLMPQQKFELKTKLFRLTDSETQNPE
jgi:hypothetical protein